MKKAVFILFLLFNISNTYSQKWWKEAIENSIPSNLSNDTLIVEKFSKGQVFRTDKKVARANKKLERTFRKHYPFQYLCVESDGIANTKKSNTFSHREHFRSYSAYGKDIRGNYSFGTSSYYTNIYYFQSANSDETFDEIEIFSSFRFKTLREILLGISMNVADLKRYNIIKVDVFDNLFGNKNHFSISYERAIYRVFSAELSYYSGIYNDKFDEGYFRKYRIIYPEFKFYRSKGVEYARGLYLGFGPIYNRVEMKNAHLPDIENVDFEWYNVWGISPSLGLQHRLMNNFILSWNLKIPIIISDTQKMTHLNFLSSDFHSNFNVKIGYEF